VTGERAFLEMLRALPLHEGARGLVDDAAVIEFGGRSLVLTHDLLVEGVHYLPSDPPGDVAWKLLAVNLSDLAAKGARPLAALLGYGLGEGEWDRAFVAGLGEALAAFGTELLGGDTVRSAAGAPRTLALTALGTADGPVPSRSGASAGDDLWVTGTIGDSGAGLSALREGRHAEALVERYRRPAPRLEAGRRLAPLVGAMMDVSDGLLIDASRLAEASGCGCGIELAQVPLSRALVAAEGDGLDARLRAASAGDDYELLFAAEPSRAGDIGALSADLGLKMTRVGALTSGEGLGLSHEREAVALPSSLGWEHR
jgi:thiamine-monophosphate kinase